MSRSVSLRLNGHDVTISNPDKLLFPDVGITKLQLIEYYLKVSEGVLRGIAGRPMILKRFVKGITEEAFFQKRAPKNKPEWLDTAELHYASGTSAAEAVVRDTAGLAWVLNLGCIDLNPHPVRAEDLEHPDELRVDLDPLPGVPWEQVIDVAFVARDVLADYGLTGWPKTSGSKGFHIYARITPQWTFADVRLAAQTLAREVARRAPDLATSRWWKEERHGVFVDFNQNAKDRTVASVYSVRPTPDARVSAPLSWDEVADFHLEDLTVPTVAARYDKLGDLWAGMDETPGSLAGLLELAQELGPPEKPPKGVGRRRITRPIIEVARTKTKPEAMEALDRWKVRHDSIVPFLEPADILLDSMRGSSSVWYRVRINLLHVPPARRPAQGPLEADYNPWERQ